LMALVAAFAFMEQAEISENVTRKIPVRNMDLSWSQERGELTTTNMSLGEKWL
jgi:hypothetical protein